MSKQNYGLPPKDPALLELIRLRAERDALAALLPGVYYMDPPDGGNVDLVEQLRRMAKDAARYRWLRDEPSTKPDEIIRNFDPGRWDAAIDAALAGDKP